MILRPINMDGLDISTLYELLKERTVTQSISHKEMPTHKEHVDFIKSEPYKAWYIIEVDGEIVGSTYLSKANEIGIFIFEAYKRKGYAVQAVKKLMSMHEGPFLANINPHNHSSRGLFGLLGFKHIQETYRHD